MTTISLGHFGDARREAAGILLHDRLVGNCAHGVSVRGLGGDRAGEIRLTRFLHNDAVSIDEMVATAAARTAQRCAGRDVLVIQDTTVVRSDGGGGLYLHVAIAVDNADGALLGLVYATFLSREHGQRATREARAIEDKQSQRWLDGAQAAARVCAQARRITMIADRESDIYEVFAQRPKGVDLLVRAAQDRALDDGGRLFDCLDKQRAAGRMNIDVPAKPGQKARTATLAVRFVSVDLKRPSGRLRCDAPKTVSLSLVDTREIKARHGGEPLHWRLLTTWPVEDLAGALAVIGLYRCRWMIEQLFRTMKTQGFDIEALRTETDPPLRRLVMATLVAAITVQQLLHARDAKSQIPLSDAFDAEDRPLLEALNRSVEGKTQKQRNPHPPGTLAYAAWTCGRLGGWTGYYGQPGPIVLLRGWQKFQEAKQLLITLKHQHVRIY
jgi:hypothetical protein